MSLPDHLLEPDDEGLEAGECTAIYTCPCETCRTLWTELDADRMRNAMRRVQVMPKAAAARLLSAASGPNCCSFRLRQPRPYTRRLLAACSTGSTR